MAAAGAHVPTFHPAVAGSGGNDKRGKNLGGGGVASLQFSARDAPAQMTLKLRASGQGNPAEISRRDLKAELDQKEALTRSGAGVEDKLDPEPFADLKDFDDDDESFSSSDGDDEVGSESDDGGSSDEDDADELMAELARIRKERAEEASAKAKLDEELERSAKVRAAVGGNPLLASSSSSPGISGVKRRWDDDVPFRNQARSEPKAKKRFINDTVRSDFHKKFLHRFIK